MQDFLPVTKKEMKQRGWEQVDFAYITGDAYVDHPSFGTAIISRLLESRGYKVGIIPQPDWRKKESIQVFGEPRLGFLVSAGNMDSMVNHYTVSKKHRQKDSYSPGGQMGLRPDRAVIVYSNLIRQTYKQTPVILGGIEASLRRLAHYDYWSDKVKHSVLIDSGADIISYGMGEHSIVEIADALNAGIDVKDITYINGTVYKTKTLDNLSDYINLPSYDEIVKDKRIYAESFYTQYKNTDPFTAKILVEKAKEKQENKSSKLSFLGTKVVREYSEKEPSYSKTLDLWEIHKGLDISADKGYEVKSLLDGKVVNVFKDDKHGISVRVEGANNVVVVYSNLDEKTNVKKGQEVTEGQVLGTVGNTTSVESEDGTHVHVEAFKGEESIDPMTLLK